MKQTNEQKKQIIKNIRSWIPAKEVQIREAQEQVETQEFYIKQLKENINSGFYIKQKNKEIKEQQTEASKKMKELDLELLKKKLEINYFEKQAEIVMEDLKIKLQIEEKTLSDLNKKIILLERNHKEENKEEIKNVSEKN